MCWNSTGSPPPAALKKLVLDEEADTTLGRQGLTRASVPEAGRFVRLGDVHTETITPLGEGALHLAFEKLKRALAEEGLFDHDRKKPLPSVPHAIGMDLSFVAGEGPRLAPPLVTPPPDAPP